MSFYSEGPSTASDIGKDSQLALVFYMMEMVVKILVELPKIK